MSSASMAACFDYGVTPEKGKKQNEKDNASDAIAWHHSLSNGARTDQELMQNSARALSTSTDPLEKLRLICLSRGAAGIMELGRVFRRMDDDRSKILNKHGFKKGIRAFRRIDDYGSKELNRDEFESGIKHTGLELTEDEADELFKVFDKDGTGYISVDELIKHIRPPMSENRKSIIETAFRKLDKTGEGAITLEDLRRVYSINSNPRYMNGQETASVVMNKFLAHFEGDGIVDGKVTLEEFMNYYSGISVSIDDDCFFDLMMRQAYKL